LARRVYKEGLLNVDSVFLDKASNLTRLVLSYFISSGRGVEIVVINTGEELSLTLDLVKQCVVSHTSLTRVEGEKYAINPVLIIESSELSVSREIRELESESTSCASNIG
jgi:hypothetical protein